MIKIPKIFHRIWLGDNPMPEEFKIWGKTWTNLHPNWQMKEWNNTNGIKINHDYIKYSKNVAQTSDLLRYEILYKHGGIYIDTDFVCQKNIEPLLEDASFVGAGEYENMVSAGFIAATPNHPIIKEAILSLQDRIQLNMNQAKATGPGMLTSVWENHKDDQNVKIYGPKLFYPYGWKEPEKKHDEFKDAYAIHHWAGSWRKCINPK